MKQASIFEQPVMNHVRPPDDNRFATLRAVVKHNINGEVFRTDLDGYLHRAQYAISELRDRFPASEGWTVELYRRETTLHHMDAGTFLQGAIGLA